jgi:hypothetical protein
MRQKLLLVLLGFSSAIALAAGTLVPFKPVSLPETIKPDPIPKGMTDFPANQIQTTSSCSPEVRQLQVPTQTSSTPIDASASQKIQVIVDADQNARKNITADTDWQKLMREDQDRRQQLLELIPLASTATDFANIALVFQHGDCINHYLLANYFATLGMKENDLARWLVAATMDRALMNAGRAQKYGTQYVPRDSQGKCFALYVVDPRTTDAERVALRVPTLEEAINRAKMFNAADCP